MKIKHSEQIRQLQTIWVKQNRLLMYILLSNTKTPGQITASGVQEK